MSSSLRDGRLLKHPSLSGAVTGDPPGGPGRRDDVAGHADCRSTESRGKDAAAPPPKTPTCARDVQKEMEKLGSVLSTAKKTPRSPAKSSPCKQPYLTKESNVTGFPAFDMDERLHQVESQFKVMKEAMDTSLTDRKTLEEAVDLAKTRGR